MKTKGILDSPQRKLILVILIIVLFSGVAYWEYQLISNRLDTAREKKIELDGLKLHIKELDKREEDFSSRKALVETVTNYFPTSDNLLELVKELEDISQITNTSMNIQFESATVSEGGIIFDDEGGKKPVLDDIKDTPSEPVQDLNTGGNAALNLLQAPKTVDEDTKLNFLDASINVSGKYADIMSYIVTLKESRYLLEVYDIQFINQGETVNSTMLVRIFISNQ